MCVCAAGACTSNVLYINDCPSFKEFFNKIEEIKSCTVMKGCTTNGERRREREGGREGEREREGGREGGRVKVTKVSAKCLPLFILLIDSC